MTFTLPYPPSVNHIWRRCRGRTVLSAEALAYRDAVRAALIDQGHAWDIRNHEAPLHAARLHVELLVHPPDRRRRDIDNISKAALDALQHTGLFADDWQIDHLSITRGSVVKGGRLDVTIEVAKQPQPRGNPR